MRLQGTSLEGGLSAGVGSVVSCYSVNGIPTGVLRSSRGSVAGAGCGGLRRPCLLCSRLSVPGPAGVVEYVRSGGVYGIESDCGPGYLDEIVSQEIADLGRILADLGISGRAYGRALADCDREPVAA